MDEHRILIFSDMLNFAPHEPAPHNPNNTTSYVRCLFGAFNYDTSRSGAGSTNGWCGGSNGIRTRVSMREVVRQATVTWAILHSDGRVLPSADGAMDLMPLRILPCPLPSLSNGRVL